VCGSRLFAPLLAACTHAFLLPSAPSQIHRAQVNHGYGHRVVAATAMMEVAGLSDRGPRSLRQSELQLFDDQRYLVVKDWLSAPQTDHLQADAIAVGTSSSAFDCCVGSRDGGARLDHTVRRSRACPFYPPPPNAAGSVAVRSRLIQDVQKLRMQLQASAIIALPYLEPFETELSYLLYPIGGHYHRHLDIARGRDSGWTPQGRKASEGGSFCGGRTRRVVSFILYLNRKWDGANGGNLRVYAAHEFSTGAAHKPAAPHVEDVVPEGGTLVLIMSGDVEHMVRETRAERQCIVGWFNEYREERIADRDTFGTHTWSVS